MSKAKGSGFTASAWLENDGDLAVQQVAAARPGFTGPKAARQAVIGGRALLHLTGKSALRKVAPGCHDGALIVLNSRMSEMVAGNCQVYDQRRLRRTGSIAAYLAPDGLRMVTARDLSGWRYWNSRRSREAILAPNPPKGQ